MVSMTTFDQTDHREGRMPSVCLDAPGVSREEINLGTMYIRECESAV